MKNKNICKFIQSSTFDKLETHRFIFETDESTIKQPQKLVHNRMFLITTGSGVFKFDKSLFPFHPGSLILGFRDETVIVDYENKCEYLYIDFSGERSQELFHRFGINKVNRVFDNFDSLIPLWHDSLSRASEMNIELATEGILLYTFSRMKTDSSKKNNLITKILEISEENFANQNLSLLSISEELGYNSKYISHFFKEKMGIGYSEYLKNLRIKYSVSLFDHGIDSVKNVAFLSGFSDPLYFSTVFKKSVGCSPKEYINRLL